VVQYTILRLLSSGHLEESATRTRASVSPPPLVGRVCLHVEAGGVIYVCDAEAALPLPRQGRVAVCGSGLSPEAAEESARKEAAERYSLHFQPSVQVIRRSWESAKAEAIHPGRFILYSDIQRTALGGYGLAEVTDWVEGRSLMRNRACLIPAACCYFGYPRGNGGRILRASSNGCAAGTDFEDATVRAFLESVERDAIAIWWYNRLRRPSAPMPVPLGTSIAAELARQGHRLELLDLTTGLGIPVVGAVAVPHDGAGVRFGFGAAWDLEQASLHAITELCQSLSTPEFHVGGGPVRLEPWLAASTNSERLKHSSRPAGTSLESCMQVAAHAGHDLIVVNQTRPETGTPVARVIVPGLRPAVPRFAPGRLYDEPVRLDWIAARSCEAGLNPVPFDI
jgi:ribosomal protein S12 methylthiotransferase accessory factor